MTQQQHRRLTFRQWMEAYYIASIPTILTMENFRITTAVAGMLKTLARNKRPSVKPEVMMEELIEEAYRKKFRK